MAIGKFQIIIPSGEFVNELKEFSFDISKDFKDCDLTIEKLRDLILEQDIDKHTSQRGDLLYGTQAKGIRKIRLAKRDNKGKRAGYRLVAFVVASNNKMFVLHIYDKKKKTDLTKKEKEHLKELLKSFR